MKKNIKELRKIGFYYIDPYGLVTADEGEELMEYISKHYNNGKRIDVDDGRRWDSETFFEVRQMVRQFLEDTMMADLET